MKNVADGLMTMVGATNTSEYRHLVCGSQIIYNVYTSMFRCRGCNVAWHYIEVDLARKNPDVNLRIYLAKE